MNVTLYRKPADVKSEWKSLVIDEAMHATHNFDVLSPNRFGKAEFVPGIEIGGREGTRSVQFLKGWIGVAPSYSRPFEKGVGEIRKGNLNQNVEITATVEPMHGNQLTVYLKNRERQVVTHRVLTDKLNQGHALACADVLGTGSDQIIVGWRGAKPGDSVGLAVWTALDDKGEQWRETVIDKETACEDLAVADLDGDGKPDVIAAGRASHNLRILWNDR